MQGEKIVRRKLADGTMKEYRYRRQLGANSLGALILRYRQSAAFARLKPATQYVYNRAFGHMEPIYKVAVVELKRRHAIMLRDAFQDTPALANQIVKAFGVLMRYAVEMEYRETNPAAAIGQLAGGQHARWPDEAVAYAIEHLPQRFSRAVLLGLYSGQRLGDVVRMGWSDYDGDGIRVVQEKTGAKLWIPCHYALRDALEAWKADRQVVTILVDGKGKPWRAGIFSTVFAAEKRQHVQLAGLVYHGLRKTAAAKLAEAGCSPHEIGAITGHRSLAMLQHYTLEAEQETRARAAILKLEKMPGKRQGNRPQVVGRKRP